jgi:hypothetical protein
MEKRIDGVAQVVEYLFSKCEALSSNPSTVLPPPKKEKKEMQQEDASRTVLWI